MQIIIRVVYQRPGGREQSPTEVVIVGVQDLDDERVCVLELHYGLTTIKLACLNTGYD